MRRLGCIGLITLPMIPVKMRIDHLTDGLLGKALDFPVEAPEPPMAWSGNPPQSSKLCMQSLTDAHGYDTFVSGANTERTVMASRQAGLWRMLDLRGKGSTRLLLPRSCRRISLHQSKANRVSSVEKHAGEERN